MGGRKTRLRRRRSEADCRRGVHRYGSAKPIGGGITRQTCFVCGAVSIDLTAAEPPSSRTFPYLRSRKRAGL